MEPKLGRFLQDLRLEDQRLVVRLKDLWEGLGDDVGTRVQGRRLEALRAERVFVRMLLSDPGVRLVFPAGAYDPAGRLEDLGGTSRAVHLRDDGDLDLQVRRMIESSYRGAE